MDLSIEGRILTSSSHVFSLKLLCKKDAYNISHCEGIVKKIFFFSFVGHCTINVSNPMPHLTCCACLVFVMKIYATIVDTLKKKERQGETRFTTKTKVPPPLNANFFFFWVGFYFFEFHLIYLVFTLFRSTNDDELFLKKGYICHISSYFEKGKMYQLFMKFCK